MDQTPRADGAVKAAIDGSVAGDLTWALATLCFGVLLWWAALGEHAAKLLGRGPLAFAGRVSYSAYLLHLPVLFLWNREAAALSPWLSLPLYLAATFALSWLSWRFVEQPFLRPGPAKRPRHALQAEETTLANPR